MAFVVGLLVYVATDGDLWWAFLIGLIAAAGEGK